MIDELAAKVPPNAAQNAGRSPIPLAAGYQLVLLDVSLREETFEMTSEG